MKTTRITISLEVYDSRILEGALRYGVTAGIDIDLQQPAIMPWHPEWPEWVKTAQAWQGFILQVKLAEHLPLLRRAQRRLIRPMVLLGAKNVNLRGRQNMLCPHVVEDDYSVGRLAADHFMRLKFRRFAVIAQNLDAGYSERIRGFQDGLASSGSTARNIIFQEARRHAPKLIWGDYIRNELREATKPLAVLALDDMIGDSVAYSCSEEGLAVPEEVAVLGVGNNNLICDYCHPPLSSIDMNGERLGWTAAKLLHDLIKGGTPPAEPLVVQPRGVIQRRSTEIFSAEDPRAVRAIRFIWDHLHEPLKTADIASAVGLSRRSLNRIFVSCFGHTIKMEQTRMRMLRIREMLASSDMPSKAIAQAVGFRTQEHMCRVFLAEHKMTIKQYCRQIGARTVAPWAVPSTVTTRLVEGPTASETG